MYMQVKIHDGEEDPAVDAFEHFDGELVIGFVAPNGDEIDMASFVSPRIVYVSREELMALPA
jgi:hypothetical protein